MRFLALLAAAAVLSACQGGGYRDRSVPIATVTSVDLARYAGTWYEVARFPNWFQGDCVDTRADYALRSDGRVDVLNTCNKGAPDGSPLSASGIAQAIDTTNSRLKVKFVPWLPFEGDYWILYLDSDYRTAVVGNPDGNSGWILSRTPDIEPARLERALLALERNGYDVTRLDVWAPHGGPQRELHSN